MRVRRGTTQTVREFWEGESCGERYSPNGSMSYSDIDSARYALEPMIPEFAGFERDFDGRGLEIGLGTGADHIRLRGRGGTWAGVDLTFRSLQHVTARLGSSSGLAQGDAERLPFRDRSFDLVYSWGVILCCPSIEAAVAEIHRVLKPGGTVLLMLYHSPSWVAFAAWFRWGWWRGIGLKNAVTFMESPGTQAFSLREGERLFKDFSDIQVTTHRTSWDKRWMGPLARLGGDSLGWFMLCRAQK